MSIKVVIATPSGDTVMVDYAFSLAQLVVETSQVCQVVLCNPKSSLVQKGRYQAVKQAQELGADYLFFLDSDQTVPSATVLRLLSHKKDIVGATYSRRSLPFEPVTPIDLLNPVDGLAKVSELPAGCIFHKTKARRKVPPKDGGS